MLAAKHVEALIQKSRLTLTENMEILLELDDHTDFCGYYIADHQSHMIFWLEEVSTEDLEFREPVSHSHYSKFTLFCLVRHEISFDVTAGLALEANYWAHIEHFPLHLVGLSSRCLDDLVSILIHGRAGQSSRC